MSKTVAPAPAKAEPVPSKRDEVEAFLDTVRAMPQAQPAGGRGRLIFAMDATMSRQPTWDRALKIQAEMFHEAGRIGGLDVQLVYFRGFGECRASKWVSEPDSLARLMTGLECRGGDTQIGKVLAHIERETAGKRVNAAVFVGDAMEENIDKLCRLAGEIGLQGVPLFLFQEGRDPHVERAFRELARLTRGAYVPLDSASPRMLADLLRAVAAYAAGGRKALADCTGRPAQLLLEQLS